MDEMEERKEKADRLAAMTIPSKNGGRPRCRNCGKHIRGPNHEDGYAHNAGNSASR